MENLRTKLENVRQSAIDNIKRMVKPGECVLLSNEVDAVYIDSVAEVAVAEHIRIVERDNSGDLYAVYSNDETQDTCDLSCYPTENIIALCEEVAHSRTNASIQRIKELLDGKPYMFNSGLEPTWHDVYNGNMYRCVLIKPCEVTDEFPLGLQFEVNVKSDNGNWGLWSELPAETLRFMAEQVADKISREKIGRINELLGGYISFPIPLEEKVTWTDPNNGEEVQCDLVSAASGKIDLRVFETRNNCNFGHLDSAPIECLDKIIAIIEKYAVTYKRLMDLTDEQKQAFNEFIAARNKLKELGVVIFRDETDCVDYIFNGTNFEDIDVFCTKEDETDPRKLDISNLLGLFECGSLCDIAFHTDGYSFYGKLKEGVKI
jgi:hypothetical protein